LLYKNKSRTFWSQTRHTPANSLEPQCTNLNACTLECAFQETFRHQE
jgi:hypothetical protein